MEKNIEEVFEMMKVKKVNPRMYSPLTLAFIGDSVYDLIIRTKVVTKANAPVNKLHRESSQYVKASAQAAMILKLQDSLTDEEVAVYKRGRNAKSGSVPKNAKLIDYKNATGYEALVGYLYLKGQLTRIFELVNKGLDEFEAK